MFLCNAGRSSLKSQPGVKRAGLNGGLRLRVVVAFGGSSVLLNHSAHGAAVSRLPASHPEPRLETARQPGGLSAPTWIGRAVVLLVCWEAATAAAAGATVL